MGRSKQSFEGIRLGAGSFCHEGLRLCVPIGTFCRRTFSTTSVLASECWAGWRSNLTFGADGTRSFYGRYIDPQVLRGLLSDTLMSRMGSCAAVKNRRLL